MAMATMAISSEIVVPMQFITTNTTQGTGESCPEGWVDIHPQVAHYQGADCSPTGDPGSCNTWTAPSSKVA